MKWINLFPLLLLTMLFAGCGGETAPATTSEAPAPAPAPAEMPGSGDEALIAEGKTLFEGTAICFTCHGADGTGTQLAPNLTDGEWLNIEEPVDIEKLSNLIKTGVTEPKQFPAPMPPMANLTDDQVKAVATYVLSLGS